MKPILTTILFGFLLSGSLLQAQLSDSKGFKDPPLFSRLPDYFLSEGGAFSEARFDSYAFRVVTGSRDEDVRVEGHFQKYSYSFDESRGTAPASPLQIIRKYQSAATRLGGRVLYDGGDRTTLRITKNGEETWAFVEAFSNGYNLILVERKTMTQDVTYGPTLNPNQGTGLDDVSGTQTMQPAAAGTGPGASPGSQPASAGTGSLLANSSEPFTVTPVIAKPFVTVTFSYSFPAIKDGTYTMRCLREDQADNQPPLFYKDLTPERRDGYLSGTFSREVGNAPAFFGKYSFRIFGPVKVILSKGGMGAQEISKTETQVIFNEGHFRFVPYETTLTVPSTIPPRGTLRITWNDASQHPAAWIGLFKRENANEYPILRKSFVNLPGGVWELQAPSELGNYDVRAFINQAFTTTTIQPFEVTWGTLHPVVSGWPKSCYPNVSIQVSYANGPADNNAMVGIFDATNPSTQSPLSWSELQGKSSGDFVFSAPGNTGRYDVRMVDSLGNTLIRSSAFQVVAASKTIRVSAKVDNGYVVLSWNNPADYQMMAGYYIYRGLAPGKESPTPITAAPMPTDRTAGASTQINGYIDTAVKPGTKYYYLLKPLSLDLKTFGTASNEVSIEIPSGIK